MVNGQSLMKNHRSGHLPFTIAHFRKHNKMLKFIKGYAASIQGVDIYPMISLLIFVLFFIGVLYYVKKMDTDFVSDMNHLPLESGEMANPNTNA